MSIIRELRRRNVLRMALLYIVAAWLIMQVTEVLVALTPLPQGVGPVIIWLLAIGFPISLIISWFYEITPEGISLDENIDPKSPATHLTSRRLNFIVISMLCAAVILFAYDKWWIGEPPERSIAVLPFSNLSADANQEYFSDGLSDTLIHVLAQVSGLKVTAKTSSFYFKGKDVRISEIAEKLQVAHVLEGSVQKFGNRVRVIAQLINAEDGTHLWSKSFDRDLVDLFAVQDGIAQEVVQALKVTLLKSEGERLAQRYQPPLEAYEQLILGRYEKAKLTTEGIAAAEQHFKHAIELDPAYALPYAELADVYHLQIFFGVLVMEESLQRRQPLVKKALELDPYSAEAYMARAALNSNMQIMSGEKSPNSVEDDIFRAFELSPNSADGHHWYGDLLSTKGRLEEALAQFRLAAILDPMSRDIQLSIGNALWNVGHAEEAVALVRNNIQQTPEYPRNYDMLAWFHTWLGHLGEAQRWRSEAHRRDPGNAYTWLFSCIGFLNLGDLPAAGECFDQLSETHPDKIIVHGGWPLLHAYRGEWNAAVKTLELRAERAPGYGQFFLEMANLIAGQGDLERARRLMAEAFPGLLGDESDLGGIGLNQTLVFASILNASGETRRRDDLLGVIEKRIASMHRIRGIGYGIVDVYVHVMRGDRNRAIASLRQAIDAGWRVNRLFPLDGSWWTLRQDWKLGSLHQDPEFIALMDELEADINVQRQWYEENKDTPLF